ncbi:DUF2201 family putative metallopeptidase [Sessilibacter corallicola]|uniref:Metallopeptidase domain-containing protein n=1 Tax=Sessilibacter corallicola TaxID=2904075 RepID=A0ABQ0A9Q1_9GAMM
MSQLDLSLKPAQNTANANGKKAVLNRQTAWNTMLQALRSHIIQSDEKGLPRFGVLSILARRVPFHLYDHPALARMCDTAFTDGTHVFVNTEFFKETTAQDNQRDSSGLKTHSMVLILLHELSHILFRHHARLPPKAPPLLWAIACDTAINARLLTGYPQLRPGPVFDNAWGTKRDEIDTYLGQSEEHILNAMWEEPNDNAREFVNQLKAKLNDESEHSVKPKDDQRGEPQDIHNHMVTPEQLAKTLDENGLRHIRDTLQLPDPNDKPAYQNLNALFELNLMNDLDKAKEMRELHPIGHAMAGDHLETSSSEWVDQKYRAQVEWKNLLRELVLGDGIRYEHCDELPSDIYYVPPEHMQLEAPLFIGEQMPAANAGVMLVIIDTSKSVSVDLLATFMGELAGLIEQENTNASQLYLTSADTTFRGDMLKFSQQDLTTLPEKLLLQGRGGTDITNVINEALHWADNQHEFNPEELKAVIYFSDLLDRPPKREQLPEHLPQLLFLTPPSLAIKAFKKHIEDFATLAEIKEGTVVDLCQS